MELWELVCVARTFDKTYIIHTKCILPYVRSVGYPGLSFSCVDQAPGSDGGYTASATSSWTSLMPLANASLSW